MSLDLLPQFLLSGLTVGAIYALVALGFAIIYNASHVINFAQGEFVMLGGMISVALHQAGLPLPVAFLGAILLAILAGLALERLTLLSEVMRRIQSSGHAKGDRVVTLIIITIGAAIFLRGLVGMILGKNYQTLEPFSGRDPLHIGNAVILPQNLWIMGATAIIGLALWLFFSRSLLGRAILATAHNRLAAQLMGIDTRFVLLFSFALSAALGATGGILITPIAPTHFEVGVMLGLKGFAAAIVGGLGNGVGAVAGGLIVGVAEALSAGYLSSAYKDAVAFIIILAVLLLRPSGLFSRRSTERV